MINYQGLDIYFIFDTFILLLIGMGPKIALVPFLEETRGLTDDGRREVADKMVRTALVTALILFILGAPLMRLLHFTSGAASIAGGIILLLLALRMLVGPAAKEKQREPDGQDLLQKAVYPLAVPYLLNPAGIAALVTFSGIVDSPVQFVSVIGIILIVGLIDTLVFRNSGWIARHIDPARLVVTESVFGILLAALAVQLVTDGLFDLSIMYMQRIVH